MKQQFYKSYNKITFWTRLMLSPTPAVFDKCSDQTRNNFSTLSKVLAFTAPICGAVLGASLTKFCFNSNPVTYLFTIPSGIILYVLMDRLVIMADAHKNAGFIRGSRLFIAVVFSIFNSFLIDTYLYSGDIAAERTKEIVIAQNAQQARADAEKKAIQLHKEELHHSINKAAAPLRERNNQLVQEAEGTGGSRAAGKGEIYEAKKEAFTRDSVDFARQNALLLAELAKDDSALARVDRELVQKKANAASQISNGFNHNMELLHKVVFNTPFNIFVSFLFFCICTILELLPLLAKNYIDISEYFKHAKNNVDAFLENRELHKQHIIKEERHYRTLEHNDKLQTTSHEYALLFLTQKAQHSENILHITERHFSYVIESERDMALRFPDHFSKHIAPVFASVYAAYQKNHPKAINTGTLLTEKT